MCKQKVLIAFLLVYAFGLCGCGVNKKTSTASSASSKRLTAAPAPAPRPVNKEIGKTPADRDKERQLRRIDMFYNDPVPHYQLGKLYQADGLWSKAEQEYGIALNFDPVYREAQTARVKALVMMNDKDKADLLADIYLNSAGNSAMASLKLALGFQEYGLDAYVLRAYEQALRLAPNSAKINKQLGFYHMSKGKKVEAKGYLTRSFQLDPYQPDVAGELGKLGVIVTIPRKVQTNTSSLDREIDKSTAKKR